MNGPPLRRTHAFVLVMAVLLLHAVVLSDVPQWFSAQPPRTTKTPTFVTRQIELPPSPNEPPARAQPKPSRPIDATTNAAVATSPRIAAEPPANPHAVQPLDLDGLDPSTHGAVTLPARAASGVDLPPFARPTEAGNTEPTAFLPPNSATLKYHVIGEIKKFNYSAHAELQWKQTSGQYDARFEVGAFLIGSRVQTSTGLLGAEGLMPLRFSDKSRSELAVHFQRDKGIISFSANTPDMPLLKGSQDRLSVVLQLSALLAGEPSRYPVGTMLSIQTVSQREAEVWQFKVEKEELLNMPYGDLATLKVLRTPRQEFDQRIELWFAPSLGYLPVRMKITNANADMVDLTLRSVEKTE